jgi:exosortase J
MLPESLHDRASASVVKGFFPHAAAVPAISRRLAAAIAAALAILALPAIWSTLLALWQLWMTDALKSIGMVIPLVSFLLILRVWRSLRWEMHGTWWGLLLLILTALLVRIRDQAILLLVLDPRWTLTFPPHSLVVFAYGAGLVLLFGGVRLFRAALFPLVLLLFVNPIPHVFNVYVDLPLQRASAHVARAFAMALGQPLSPDKLRLMFTPDFGMFIAPGCNGIRGAVTMGLIALVAGYLYRFRLRAHILTVAGAILLGYIFNFLRLCVLVVYYVLALPHPWLQQHAEGADYVIGGTLFFIAVYLLNVVITRLGSTQEKVLVLPQAPGDDSPTLPVAVSHSFLLRATAVFVLAALCTAGVVHAAMVSDQPERVRAEESAQGQFPATLGSYQRVRTWNETLIGGALLFHWADYAAPGGGAHVAIGISPFLGSHDTLVCHSARGEDPLWHGQDTLRTATQPIDFSAAFFNDGATQSLEATTLCTGSTCGEYATPPARFGFVYSRPHPESLFQQNPQRPIPILIKVETIDTTLPPDVARAQLTASLADFLSGVDLDALTRPYRRQ